MRCQTPIEGCYLQVKHKYGVPPSERCQTPFEGFHLQVIHKYNVPLSERCKLPVRGRMPLIYKLYINKVYLLLKDAKLLLSDAVNKLHINKVYLFLRDQMSNTF